MTEIVCTTRIEASPSRVFAVFTDFASAPRRLRSILHLEVLDEGPIGVGTRFRETRSFFNREATEELTVTAFDPPDRYAVTCESHGARFLSTYVFRAAGDGTEVAVTFSVQPRSILARLLTAFPRLMLNPVRKCTEADLEDLKRTAESNEEASGGRHPNGPE